MRKPSILVAVVAAMLVSAIVGADGTPVNYLVPTLGGTVHYWGDAPTLSGCTSECTLATYSTDARGSVECTNNLTTCTITFSTPYLDNPPACVMSGTGGAVVLSAPTTTTAFSFPAQRNATLYYHCDGMIEPDGEARVWP